MKFSWITAIFVTVAGLFSLFMMTWDDIKPRRRG
jgi:hypothetical protein